MKRESVDASRLASTYVGSPDPRQKNPPKGEELLLTWRLPMETNLDELVLVLEILYKDYTQETIRYPISKRRGLVTYSLLGDKYKETGGFLTYKGEVQTAGGAILREWKQQLWTELIVVD